MLDLITRTVDWILSQVRWGIFLKGRVTLAGEDFALDVGHSSQPDPPCVFAKYIDNYLYKSGWVTLAVHPVSLYMKKNLETMEN